MERCCVSSSTSVEGRHFIFPPAKVQCKWLRRLLHCSDIQNGYVITVLYKVGQTKYWSSESPLRDISLDVRLNSGKKTLGL
jgi:hypothetical protein